MDSGPSSAAPGLILHKHAFHGLSAPRSLAAPFQVHPSLPPLAWSVLGPPSAPWVCGQVGSPSLRVSSAQFTSEPVTGIQHKRLSVELLSKVGRCSCFLDMSRGQSWQTVLGLRERMGRLLRESQHSACLFSAHAIQPPHAQKTSEILSTQFSFMHPSYYLPAELPEDTTKYTGQLNIPSIQIKNWVLLGI